ncbi:hypothetical protein SAMN02745131_00687 [Flavisolibacter ginsengisoli DSM 18119]|uniref:Uncharacterized protein n=1 Tax=Flavisolibacter ginsengisoli DSM 18119 TaxID=1121884 RepID=A0A1M4UKK9_9BACT|nr:hypothetical protein SAMN02745131_00687 [Flavisolibacter ginsengisoli DSM 18119]
MTFSSHNLDRESVKNLQLVGETFLFIKLLFTYRSSLSFSTTLSTSSIVLYLLKENRTVV